MLKGSMRGVAAGLQCLQSRGEEELQTQVDGIWICLLAPVNNRDNSKHTFLGVLLTALHTNLAFTVSSNVDKIILPTLQVMQLRYLHNLTQLVLGRHLHPT